MLSLLHPEDGRKLPDVLWEYKKGALAQHGLTRNNLKTITK